MLPAFLLLLALAGPLAAQAAPRHAASLLGWADGLWLTILDRDGGYFGRVADEGILQRFNPLMDDEYELDIWAGLFSPWEEARWAAAARGVRAGGTSISHPHTVNLVDWRHDAAIAGPVDFLAGYARRGSLTEQRDYVAVGTRWRDVLGTGAAARIGIGVHFFKPSGDIEVGLAREWTDGPGGAWRLDARVVFLDAVSNIVFNRLGVEPEEADTHFEYTTMRYAGRLALVRLGTDYRAELHAGGTTRSTATVTFPATGDPGYTLSEQVAFLGGLGQVRLGPRAVVALFATVAYAATDRRGAPDAGRDLRLRETTRAAGGTAWVELDAARGLGIEADARVVWRPEDRVAEGVPRVRHDDREVLLHLGLARRPAVAGWQWRLAYARMDREAGGLAPQLTALNNRNLMEAGYRFGSGFELMGGVRWDLDRLGGGAFDGGHLRLMATW